MSVRLARSERRGLLPLALGLATAAIAGHFVSQDANDKHREATDKQDEILAELRRVRERLDQLEARP